VETCGKERLILVKWLYGKTLDDFSGLGDETVVQDVGGDTGGGTTGGGTTGGVVIFPLRPTPVAPVEPQPV
jgi:hypothetical protein